ncbi:MAG: NAD(P)/FAD-dependent oxidoreductase [Pseudomonadota bacterium]
MTDYDVVLVGGGHNGLVCASYLAKAGKRVLLLEAKEQVGGAAVTREFAPGYAVSACANWLNQLSPQVIADLGLERAGMQLAASELATISLAQDGRHLTVLGGSAQGEGISAKDQSAYREFHRKTTKYAKLLAKAFKDRPPKLVDASLTDRWHLAKLGLGIKLMGKEDMSDLLRIALINMYDVMEETFEDDRLKAMLSLDSLLGSHLGPRSPNTVFGYLYRQVGYVHGYTGQALVKGGMGTLTQAMRQAAESAGVIVRTSAPVASIDLTDGRATGVTLVSGESITAKVVVSGADPRTTFEKLVGFPQLETGVVRRVSNIRMTGQAAKLHLALDDLPTIPGLDAEQVGQRLVVAPTMEYIEIAFNHSKYGEYSTAPALDISIPTVHDASLAPAGKHVMSVVVQYAPHNLREGWESASARFKQLVIDLLEQYLPGIEQNIVASELLTPVDLEREFHLAGGHWHHGEISLDQVLMMRPFPGASQYGAPIEHLYLCGAGSHPGGGVMGLAGRNAAREILKRGAAA